jgi:hypothetical protein
MSSAPSAPIEFDPAEQNLAAALRIARPVPAAGFRGALGRHLAERDPGYGPRPARLRALVAGYLGAGGLLIALAAVGLA